MTKNEFAEIVASKNNVGKQEAEKLVNVVLDVLEDALFRDGRVLLSGIGTLAVAERAARSCRNPRTGEPVPVAAARTVTFRAAQSLKNMLN